MTQYTTLNVKLSGIKNGTEVTSKLSSNVIRDSYDENNFRHKLLLTNMQISKLCKAFASGSSANIKLSIIISYSNIIRNVLKSLAESVL